MCIVYVCVRLIKVAVLLPASQACEASAQKQRKGRRNENCEVGCGCLSASGGTIGYANICQRCDCVEMSAVLPSLV